MFYHNYVDLCNKIGRSPSAAAEDIGFKRSVVTRWSKGTAPRQATLQKIADYFGVSVGYLLGTEDKKTPTANAEGVQYTDMELLMAFRRADEKTRNAIRTLLEITEDA